MYRAYNHINVGYISDSFNLDRNRLHQIEKLFYSQLDVALKDKE